MYDSTLLTMGQVQQWEERKVALEAQIKKAQEELALLSRNLEAASIFVRMKNGHTEPAEVAESASDAETGGDRMAAKNIGDAIVKVAALYPNGALPGELKGSLASSGFDMSRFTSNPGYFYTVLGRLVHRGRLERRRNGSYRLPASPTVSPEGKPGAVGAPGNA